MEDRQGGYGMRGTGDTDAITTASPGVGSGHEPGRSDIADPTVTGTGNVGDVSTGDSAAYPDASAGVTPGAGPWPARDADDERADTARAQAGSDDTIHLGGDVTPQDVAEGGHVGSSYGGTGTGGLSDATAGGARDDVSADFGTTVGGVTGSKGIAGADVGSTDAGRTDILGGGTAAGLGGTTGSS